MPRPKKCAVADPERESTQVAISHVVTRTQGEVRADQLLPADLWYMVLTHPILKGSGGICRLVCKFFRDLLCMPQHRLVSFKCLARNAYWAFSRMLDPEPIDGNVCCPRYLEHVARERSRKVRGILDALAKNGDISTIQRLTELGLGLGLGLYK